MLSSSLYSSSSLVIIKPVQYWMKARESVAPVTMVAMEEAMVAAMEGEVAGATAEEAVRGTAQVSEGMRAAAAEAVVMGIMSVACMAARK